MEREGNDLPLLIGRLLMASLFLVAGIPKVFQGYGGAFSQYLAKLGAPYPEALAIVATAVEVLGPIALVLGIFPRLTAVLMVAFVVVATGLAHRFWEFPEPQRMGQQQSFMKNIAVIGGLLFYYVSGPGRWALGGGSR
jgi:putative oxidoreductase